MTLIIKNAYYHEIFEEKIIQVEKMS